MKVTFEEIIGVELEHEGGYVNDPKDPGGETKYGVSKRAYPNEDIKNLTEEGAKDIYRRDYWERYRCAELPESLRHIYFDMCVNMGAGRATKIMQETANAKGANLKIDGGMGPMTIGAMKNVELERVRAYRVKYYATLIERKPDLAKFYFGWFKRSLEV